ncbi:MAG TPA: peptide chain release factor 2 [Steroidobacteraceae bacterium]|jgi:peptide chain release factor 2|nr:peptide chain release factor 2 [Steroidobacteraceae bacterium]
MLASRPYLQSEDPTASRWKSISSNASSKTSGSASPPYGGFFEYDNKKERLEEVSRELEDPAVWTKPERAQELGRERAKLTSDTGEIDRTTKGIADAAELLELAEGEGDEAAARDIDNDAQRLEADVRRLELKRMFHGEMDSHNAFLDIQAGAGGTEAQDWAQMLLRMYLRWAAARGFKAEVIDSNPGEVAGMKSATVEITGDYAYGWLRTETGVHRLVRKSPFDSGNRRHTSFASVFISPEVDDDIEIDINPADLKTDVYRSSGAGGQHVNKTESAVRITHMPSGIVVACQNERSQHKNRSTAMKMLKAKLYELEVNKRNAAAQVLEDSKSDVSWGNQIRSYVLDQSRIKDLRTGVEVGATDKVLDGDLDQFLEASLKAGV